MAKLSNDWAQRRRFGRPLSWQEKSMFTVDTNDTENHCERCMCASGQGKSHPTARGNSDERSVSRRSQRRTVHQQCSRLCARMCAYVRLANALSSDEDVSCVASAGKCDRWLRNVTSNTRCCQLCTAFSFEFNSKDDRRCLS